MKFTYKKFSCDVEVFKSEDGVILRFYDNSKEQSEDEIINCVIVDPGFGFLCLKIKGNQGLVSGYLDNRVFTSKAMAEAAEEFFENMYPDYIGHYHIELVKYIDYIEYNGEY